MLIQGAEETLDKYYGKHPSVVEPLLREMYGKLYWDEEELVVEEVDVDD
jgi:hypothetical protein